MQTSVVSLLLVLLSAVPTLARQGAQQTVFVVRHAERADAVSGGNSMMAADPDLSEGGRARAESLASMLKDAGIAAIFVTNYKRTQQTAEPLARALAIRPVITDARDASALAEQVKAIKGNVLVVGHSNTVPEVLKAFGVADPPAIGDHDFDNLFVVFTGAAPAAVRLRYR